MTELALYKDKARSLENTLAQQKKQSTSMASIPNKQLRQGVSSGEHLPVRTVGSLVTPEEKIVYFENKRIAFEIIIIGEIKESEITK